MLRDLQSALEEAEEEIGEEGEEGGGDGAGEDDGERERKTDAEKNLRARHTHGFGGFEDGGIDGGEPDVGVAQDGEKSVEDEGDDGGTLADATDERNGNEEPEEGEDGDSLKNAGDAERDGAPGGALDDEHAEWNADQDRDGHGDEHQREVIERGA